MKRVVIFAALLFVAIAAALAADRKPAPGDVSVSFEQIDDGLLRVTYDLDRKKRDLIFGELEAGHRARRWTVETQGFTLLRLDDGDRIHRTDGKKFNQVILTSAPDLIRIPKNYQPIAPYGDGGVMVYTGHFWPMTERGGRVNVTFDFTPSEGAQVVAFGERADSLSDWRSPMAHPAFVYMGPLAPVETDNVMALVDPAAPEWVKEDFDSLIPQVFDHLAEVFGFALETKPNLFLAAPLGRDEGRLSYSGDALPAQFQITLEGAAWLNETAQTENIFRRSTIHEAVHLWQAAARPHIENAPEWIHEGAADAIAAEAMVSLGLWGAEEFNANFDKAKTECAAELDEGSLANAEERQDYRALYACGHVIAVAVSWADDDPASAFWRAFIAEARKDQGYTENDFYDLVETRTDDAIFARAVRDFARTPLADPVREIDRLLAAAGAS